MKLISFAGQAVLMVAIVAALFFPLVMVPDNYKLVIGLIIGLATGLVALIGGALLLRKSVAGENVPADLAGLMLLCTIPTSLMFYAVGLDGIMAPNLRDISTDTKNPPALAHAQANRAGYDSPAVYRQDLVSQQLSSYPEIKTLSVALPSRDAFHISTFTVSMLGWSIIHWNSTTGQIDLQAKTRHFALKADVAIRVTPVDANNSIIDIRSRSLEGGRDFGFNARRINAFFTGFNAELKKRQKH